MITTAEAFKKFKSRLELREMEQKNAIDRHTDVRALINTNFAINDDFLTGSYSRDTKTRPLKDVDIFFVLDEEKEKKFLDNPIALLKEFKKILDSKYGADKVMVGRRSVGVDFAVPAEEKEKVLSIDVVPAFESRGHYQIPDDVLKNWIQTDPKAHATKATDANKAFSNEWKPLVKMIKKWNETQGKPIKPSFLIEVMALQLLYPPFSGGYVYELKSFFATAVDRISEIWEDPAELGSPVSDQMDTDQCNLARQKLVEVGKYIDQAIQLERQGKQGECLKLWREKIFGDMFSLS